MRAALAGGIVADQVAMALRSQGVARNTSSSGATSAPSRKATGRARDAAVLDGHGGGRGLCRIAGEDLGVMDDQVGAWCFLAGLREGVVQAAQYHESDD